MLWKRRQVWWSTKCLPNCLVLLHENYLLQQQHEPILHFMHIDKDTDTNFTQTFTCGIPQNIQDNKTHSRSLKDFSTLSVIGKGSFGKVQCFQRKSNFV